MADKTVLSAALGLLPLVYGQTTTFGDTTSSIYNGSMQYFIADIGTLVPCHPLYDRAYTWIDIENDFQKDRFLTALADAGFNGIRFPMWPDDDRVQGPDPINETELYDRAQCEYVQKKWMESIKKNLYGSFGDTKFLLHLSPAYSNRIYQESLTKEEYIDWLMSYVTDEEYRPDFLSPFSGNESRLRLDVIGPTSLMSDERTMWEINLLKMLKQSD